MEETSNSIMIIDKEKIIQKLTKIFWIFLIGSILGYGIEMVVGLVQNGLMGLLTTSGQSSEGLILYLLKRRKYPIKNITDSEKEEISKRKRIILVGIIFIFLILKFRLYKATIVELDGPTAYINIEDTIYRLSLISTKITTINGKEIARNDLKVGLEIWILQKQTLDGTVKVAFNPPFFENAVKVVCFQK